MKKTITLSIITFTLLTNIQNAICNDNNNSNTENGLWMLACLRSVDAEKNNRKISELQKYDAVYMEGQVRGAAAAGNNILFSIPDEYISIEQCLEIIKKYLADNPKKLNLGSAELIVEALKNAYPLSKAADTNTSN